MIHSYNNPTLKPRCFNQSPRLAAETDLWHHDCEFVHLLNNPHLSELSNAQLKLFCECRQIPFNRFADGIVTRRQMDAHNPE